MNDIEKPEWTDAPGIMFWCSGEPIFWIRYDNGGYWRHRGDSGEICETSQERAVTAWIGDPALVPLNQRFVDEYLRCPRSYDNL